MVGLIEASKYLNPDQVTGMSEMVSKMNEAKTVLKSSRIVCLEQIMCIALSLSQAEATKAKNLLREVDMAIASGTDGIEEESVQPTLRKESLSALQ